MTKYRVLALSLSGRNNQVFSAGQIVKEEELIIDREEDRPQKLIEGKYIERLEPKK